MKRMTSAKILNFYNVYMNKIITVYYVINSHDALNLMELGYGQQKRAARPSSLIEKDYEGDIENNIRPKQLSIKHPDDCH